MHEPTADRMLPKGTYFVAGLGRAGCAAADALIGLAAAERVIAWDRSTDGSTRSTARRLRRRGIEVRLGGDGLQALDAAGPGATVVKSPGIPLRTPLFEYARERGLEVFDELDLGFRLSSRPIVGVTGTNGKSTTSKLCATVLAAAGQPAQIVGNTEFGPPLSAAPDGGWLVCEASSFQLEATSSFVPEVGVFTNLTLEHLARHTNMKGYGATKRSMFIRDGLVVETAIVNIDDPFGRELGTDVATAGGRVLSFGWDARADIHIEDASWDMRQARQRLRTPDGVVECATALPGRHNASNVAAAFAMGHLLGLTPREVARALDGIGGPPGRWEMIAGPNDFDIVVDFAHNPDGIRQLLEAARVVIGRRPGAMLRTVCGPSGVHEPNKARETGQIARALSDHLILTTGTLTYDARLVRIDELRRAATSGGTMEVVLDRRAAVEHAIGSAAPGDVVALLGIGALGQLVVDAAGTTLPFDDRHVALEIVADLGLSVRGRPSPTVAQ
jgi:UDP-N-acetylmuramoyl-L-alanyl-D-glutamate--2,6-diaminopimelate ligase